MSGIKKNLRVALVQRIFPNYRESIYRELGVQLNVRIFHGQDSSGIHQMTNNYSVKDQMINLARLSYLCITLRLLKYSPTIFIQEFSLSFINLYINYIISRITGAKFILWGHGYNRSKGFHPDTRLLDKVLQYFIQHADSIILYSDVVAKDFSLRYPNQRFFVARNSIDSSEKREIYDRLTQKGRAQVKAELGFGSVLNVCFVARVTPTKKANLLPGIVEKLFEHGINVMVHVVGEGDSLTTLKEIVSSRRLMNNFKFYGSLYDEELVSKIIYASDFMIIPAWLGLSINHSLCYGTPVATLINERHPPEIEFAQDGVNAILGNSIDELVESIHETWSNRAAYESMRSSARQYYKSNLSLPSMLSGFSDAVDHVSK